MSEVNSISHKDRYDKALIIYDKLEGLFKTSQIVQKMFEISVLNEYRYISRALVDYQTHSDDKKDSAVSKLEVAILAAFNDILDSLVVGIKSAIINIKMSYPHINHNEILEKFGCKKLNESIEIVEKMIINSRINRENRFDEYYKFSQSKDYKYIVEFASSLQMIEYIFDSKNNKSLDIIEEDLFLLISSAFQNTMANSSEYPKFEMYYQPKYNEKKVIVSAEALVRLKLNNGEFDYIHQQGLLEAIDKSRLEYKLDLMVLELVSKDIVELKKDGILDDNFKISINVTPKSIANFDYVENMNTIARGKKIQNNIKLEILENWNEEENEHTKLNYKFCILDSSIKISIDDFGTGTTKLEYLATINNVDEIKIDKRLIDLIVSHSPEKGKRLIKGIIELAKANNLNVVAEGIEREEQLNFLKDNGVNLFQGFILSKPRPLNIFKDLIRK